MNFEMVAICTHFVLTVLTHVRVCDHKLPAHLAPVGVCQIFAHSKVQETQSPSQNGCKCELQKTTTMRRVH